MADNEDRNSASGNEEDDHSSSENEDSAASVADDEDSNSASGNEEDDLSSSENEDSDASMADTSPKRQKRGGGDEEGEVKVEKVAETKVDRLSKLPDNVLRNLLSFVPTKIAVGTCIFGKRWKNLWTSGPEIDLDDSFRFNRQNPVNVDSFINFVDKVLAHHDFTSSPSFSIKEFSLECKQRYDPWLVRSWILAIADREVKNLELTFSFYHVLDSLDQDCEFNLLPTSFFNRAHLVTLKLSHMLLLVPITVSFPSLKILWLTRLQLLGKDSLNNLLAGCPVLWQFDLIRAFWDCTDSYIIRSATIAYLTLQADACPRKPNKHRLLVETPNIELIHLSGNLEYDYDFGDLSNLKCLMFGADKDGLVTPITCEKDGQVSPNTCEKDGPASANKREEDDLDSPHKCTLSDRMVELLEKMSQVEDLYFYANVVRYLEYASFENFPMFRNLTSLEVHIADNSWRILPPLLECSPNLVKLISAKVFEGGSTPDLQGFGWYPPPSVPKCLLSCLKTIKFKGFEYYNDEIGIVEYFLKNAMVLKTIYIESKNLDLETQSLVLREILMFPRSSNICAIVFS